MPYSARNSVQAVKSNTLSAALPEAPGQRFEALLGMTRALAVCQDCDHAAGVLEKQLREVVSFDYLHLVTFAFETSPQAVAWELLHANNRTMDVSDRHGFMHDAPIEWVHEKREVLVTDDWRKETDFPQYKEFLGRLDIVSTCSLPLARGERRLGVLTFGSSRPGAYPEEERRFLELVADQLSLVLDAAANFHFSGRLQDRLK